MVAYYPGNNYTNFVPIVNDHQIHEGYLFVTFWGGDRTAMICIYELVISSKIDDCIFVCGLALQSTLSITGPVHNVDIYLVTCALCTGGLRTITVFDTELNQYAGAQPSLACT